MTDVGDAVTLTFETTTGATVTAEVYDPTGTLVRGPESVTEDGGNEGQWHFTYVGDSAGRWRATFRAVNPTVVESYFVLFEADDRPAPFATVDEYEKRAGIPPTTGTKRAQIEASLEDVSGRMRTKLPAGFEPDPVVARAICVSVTRRGLANPGGYRQRMWGSYSETTDQNGGWYFTEEEIAELLGEANPDDVTPGAYSLTMVDAGMHTHQHHGCSPYPATYHGGW
jgi:hypothetical protein